MPRSQQRSLLLQSSSLHEDETLSTTFTNAAVPNSWVGLSIYGFVSGQYGKLTQLMKGITTV